MKSLTVALTLSAALAAGCATQTNENTSAGAIPVSCVGPGGTGSAECAQEMSVLTQQSVTSDRCVESILLRDTRHGALHRAVLC